MEQTETERAAGGKFAKGRSGNPAGRPRKGRDSLRKELEKVTPRIIESLTERALAGDMQAIKLLLDRVLPPLKASAQMISIELPQDGTLSERARAFVDAAARGEIPGDLAAQLVQAIGQTARVLEVDELQARIEALEAKDHAE